MQMKNYEKGLTHKQHSANGKLGYAKTLANQSAKKRRADSAKGGKKANKHAYPKPIPGKCATTLESMDGEKNCYICSYNLFYNKELRDQAIVPFTTNEEKNQLAVRRVGSIMAKKNKEYIGAWNLALQIPYNNKKQMVYQATGGCHECKVYRNSTYD